MVLAPDELQADIWNQSLRDHMKKGAALAFAHGLNIHFNLFDVRDDLDVMMIAPKGRVILSGPNTQAAAACRP